MKFQIVSFILILIIIFTGIYWYQSIDTKINKNYFNLSQSIRDNEVRVIKEITHLEKQIFEIDTASLIYEIRKLKDRIAIIEEKHDNNFALFQYFAKNTGESLVSLEDRIAKLENCEGHLTVLSPTEAAFRLKTLNAHDNKVPSCVGCGELLTPQSPENGTRYCFNKACKYYEHLCNSNGFLLPLDPDNKPYKVKETSSECQRCEKIDRRSEPKPQGYETGKVCRVVNEGCRSGCKARKVSIKSRLFRRGFQRRVHFKNSKCFS